MYEYNEQTEETRDSRMQIVEGAHADERRETRFAVSLGDRRESGGEQADHQHEEHAAHIEQLERTDGALLRVVCVGRRAVVRRRPPLIVER